MKKILATFLALVMCLGTLNAFAAGKEFTDVTPSDWFYNDVKSAYELGLINGRDDTTYAPKDNLTYAEAIKLAACMHQLYTTGKIKFGTDDPWYKPYVTYCENNDIINKNYTYTEKATRAGYMEIFANALPGDGLKAINSVADDSIPDVPSSKDYAAGVYKLYRAGILQGVDAEHNCNPFSNITRAEVAAILTRMMDAEKRVKFTLGEETKKEEPKTAALKIAKQPIGGEIEVGGTIAASTSAEGGTSPYSYKWECNSGSGWIGITDALGRVSGQDSYRVTVNANAPVELKVRCVVTDLKGNEAITDEINFIFNPSLNFKQQPADATAEAGKPMTVSVVVAGGTPSYKYEWFRKEYYNDGKNYTSKSLIGAEGITGADTAEMTFVAKTPSTTEVYCKITDRLDKQATSNTVKLVATGDEKAEEPKVEEPKAEPFELVKAPKSTTVGTNETAVCEVEVKGGVAPYTYQWYYECDGTWNPLLEKNVDGLSGAETAKISLTRNIAETLKVRCVIIDSKKTKLTTGSATITIEDKNALKIATQPTATTVKVGEDAKLSVETEGGSENISYQWQWDISEKGGWIKMTDNDVWAGTTTPNLTVKSSAAANLLIRCVITDNDKNTRIETEGVRVKFE